MRCECAGTWKAPCLKCYHGQLTERIAEQAGGPTPQDLDAELVRSGVPAQVLHGLRAGLKRTVALDETEKFLKAEPQEASTLALLGTPGRGKSLAAAWAMREVLRKLGWNQAATGELASPVQFLEAERLTSVSDYSKLDEQWLADLRRVKLLVIDDAGDEGTKTGRDGLAKLLLHRHNKMRRSIVTGNLRRDAFESRYGAALANRISAGWIIELVGKSMRPERPEVRP